MKGVRNLVKYHLKNNPATRDSDTRLYLECIELIHPGASKQPIRLVLNDDRYPPFETVRRARQKLQETCPELRGSEWVQKHRAELEAEYREEYAK